MKKILRKVLYAILFLFIAANLWIIISGKTFVYKTLIYNYVGIDDRNIFHQRIIETGQPQPWPVHAFYNKRELSTECLAELEKQESVAFLIIKNDSLIFEKYWNGYSDTSLTNSFSMSKSFVGAMTGVALKEGLFKNPDQKVSDFIPEFRNDARNKITIRHLLSMSAALSWDEEYASLFSETTEGYYGSDIDKHMMRQKAEGEPGINYYYQGAATQILAMAIVRASGMSLSKYASEKLWKPMGAERAAEWSLDHKDGMEKASCCFYSNARDFARYGSLYLHYGNWKGLQLIDSAFISESITPAPLLDEGKPNKEYGFQWWIGEQDGVPYFYCRGILGQYIVVIPSENIVFVRLGHKRGKLPDGTLTDLPVYYRGVLDYTNSLTGS